VIRILVADDEPAIRMGLVTRTLGGPEQVEILEAEDGLDALDKAEADHPDLLLLDIHMPRLKGLDLVERLNALDRDWVIVVVSGHDEFEYARRALGLRVFEFLLKPVPEDQFRQVLGQAVRELGQRREHRRLVEWSRQQVDVKKPQGGLVAAAQDYLDASFGDPDLSLDAVATHLKVSPDHLSRLLKEATGRSFVAFLGHLRIDRAKDLLADPRLRIAEVAERVGYRDQNYFCRHFKAETGLTPSAWRTGGEASE
jgi:YesN/AraC family two-component response regulator